MRLHLHCALGVTMMLAFGPASAARAQDVDLRRLGEGGGFPTSPPDSSLPSRDRPSLDASPSAADQLVPKTSEPDTSEDRGAPNYGKPRKMKAKLYRPNPKGSPPLPGLVPYRGAPGAQRRSLNPLPAPKDAIDPAQPGPTVAVIPSLPLPRKPLVEADPYAPTGISVGALRLRPFIEASAGYESNPNQVAGAVRPSAVLRVDGGFAIDSDFSNHSFSANLRGGYSDFPSNSKASRPDAAGTLNARIDVTRSDQINLEGRFSLSTQTPGSVLLAVPNSVTITNRPLIASQGATIGAAHTFSRLKIGLRATFDRTVYGDATQSDGTIYRYSQDNYNDYGIIARADYEVTPGIIPFSELGFDDRVRDKALDLSGYYRNSIGGFARIGSSFELGRILTGTVSAGYLQRHYSDSRLPELRGPTIDAALVYAVTPLTKITARATTTASETTLAGASGAISRAFSVEIGHTFFRNFTVSGIATYQPNDYQGVAVNETFTQFTLKGTYALTRDMQIIASASRQNLKSSLAYNNYTDNVVLVGVRLQR